MKGKKKVKEPAGMNIPEIFAALAMLEKERGIPQTFMMDKIIQAVTTAYKRDHKDVENVIVDVDEEHQRLKMYVQKNVVAEEDYVDPFNEAERGMVYDEFNSKQHEILTGVVTRIDPRTNAVSLRIGTGTESTEALLLSGEQVPGEELVEGQHVKVYVVDVRRSTRGPQILISRTHPGLVKRLFELEVPEIYDGTVEVKSIAREAGSRTKMAVWSADENVDPIGPSDVVDVMMAEEGKACRVIVPDDQLSLAIGKEGQNARLAARLTGYKIDIKPESYQGEDDEEIVDEEPVQ